jgi:hypothetical protein
MNKHTKKVVEDSNSVVVVDVQSSQKTKSVDGGDTKTEFKLLRQNSAPKLRDSTQLVQYELGHVEGNLAIKITANDKDGLFSSEAVLVTTIAECLIKLPTDSSFSSRVFHSTFAKQSNNNAGFLAAILRAEKVLKQKESKLYLHELAIDVKNLEKHLSSNT